MSADKTPEPISDQVISWRKVFTDGFAPGISDDGLAMLRDELLAWPGGRLIQGQTTFPSPADPGNYKDVPCKKACAIGLAGWAACGDRATAGEVEDLFARLCFDADEAIGEQYVCRHFLNWFDGTHMSVVAKDLVPVIEEILSSRLEKKNV